MKQSAAILLLLLCMWLPGAEVRLPGTLAQVTDYFQYYHTDLEGSFVYYLNESLLFYRVLQYDDLLTEKWQRFKTRSRFREFVRRRSYFMRNESFKTPDHRLRHAVETRLLLENLLNEITGSPAGQFTIDLTQPGQPGAVDEFLKVLGLRLKTEKDGRFRVEELVPPRQYQIPRFYALLRMNPVGLEADLNKKKRFDFRMSPCQSANIPFEFDFLNRITGLGLNRDNFLEVLSREKPLQFLMGILYRLSHREIRFLDKLEPGSETWKTIYSNPRLLSGMFLLSHALRVRDSRLVTPGGDGAADFWQTLVGADPRQQPGAFIKKLATGDNGRFNFFYVFSFFLPEETRRAVFFDYNPARVKQVYRKMPLGKTAVLSALQLPQLEDFDFVTLFYALQARDGEVVFPGGVETWANALDARTTDAGGIIAALCTTKSPGENIKRFVSLYTRFFNRPELMTPEVVSTLYRDYNHTGVLIDFFEKLPLRKPQTLLKMVKWVKTFDRLKAGENEKAILAGVFQGMLELMAHMSSHEPDQYDYDALMEQLTSIPLDTAGAYDGIFQFIRTGLRASLLPTNADNRFMDLLTDGAGNPAVTVRGQSYRLHNADLLKKEYRRILRSQETCSLSTLVRINGLLSLASEPGNGPFSYADQLERLLDELPHPDTLTTEEKRVMPYRWGEHEGVYPGDRIRETYSSAQLFRTLEQLLEKKSRGAPHQELNTHVQKIKGTALLAQLQHYLVTSAYAVNIKDSKTRIFLNQNFTRLHDFYPDSSRSAWNHSGFTRELGDLWGFHLEGGLSRLSILLGYPRGESLFGKRFRDFPTQVVPVVYNHQYLYPRAHVGQAQEFAGRMVQFTMELTQQAQTDPGLRRDLQAHAAYITAGAHYRDFVDALEGKRTVKKPYEYLDYGERMRLGERFFRAWKYTHRFSQPQRLVDFRETVSLDTFQRQLDRLGSVYYHTFGTLRPRRLNLFPLPLSHFFRSKWIGGEMMDQFKIKAAYLSCKSEMPPQLLGHFTHQFLRQARGLFNQHYQNDYLQTGFMYNCYSHLYLGANFRKLKSRGVLRLK